MALSNARGSFVVVEGGEGSGKSTMLARLRTVVPEHTLILTREPGGSPNGERIREFILSEQGASLGALAQFYLFLAARADHIESKILPALEQGVHVVTDRFDMSTYAYQMFGSEHHDLKLLFRQNRERLMLHVPPPTYIYLDIDPEVGLARKKKGTDLNHFDLKKLEFHRRVRQGYQEFVEYGKVIKIDASLPEEEVWAAFKVALNIALA